MVGKLKECPPEAATALRAGASLTSVSETYGVSMPVVSRWQRELGLVSPGPGRPRAFTAGQARVIRAELAAGASGFSLARKYGVAPDTILRLRSEPDPVALPDDLPDADPETRAAYSSAISMSHVLGDMIERAESGKRRG